MKTKLSISDVINEVRNGGHVRELVLCDASRYIANAKGDMTWATTTVEAKYVRRIEGDEIVQCGNKQVNVSMLTRVLNQMVGRGEVRIWVGNINFKGELTNE